MKTCPLLSMSGMLAIAAVGAAPWSSPAGAEQRRTLSVTAEVVASCTVATTAEGSARASCDGGEVASISSAQRRGSGEPRRTATTSGVKGTTIETVTLTF